MNVSCQSDREQRPGGNPCSIEGLREPRFARTLGLANAPLPIWDCGTCASTGRAGSAIAGATSARPARIEGSVYDRQIQEVRSLIGAVHARSGRQREIAEFIEGKLRDRCEAGAADAYLGW